MSASYCARRLSHLPIEITVVDSADIPSVGVGEATVPAIRDFFAALELGEVDVLSQTDGTFKYGILFDGWKGFGESFFHPFGMYGLPAAGVPFHHIWLKLLDAGHSLPLADFCLATQLAQAGLFLPPLPNPKNDLGVFNFAVHFDASKFAAMLRRLALANGVRHVDGRIVDVVRQSETGNLKEVRLEDGRIVDGDLWIDCSGFRSLLLGEAMAVPFVDWRSWLPCDRAIAIGCEPADDHGPFTVSSAREAGWRWHIPLRNRVGNGYVYCSSFVDDDEAHRNLTEDLEGNALTSRNFLRFATGHRRETWSGNVVGIGLAAGFLEPLESTSITLIQSGLERLIALFPNRSFDTRLAATYNRQSILEFERIRDFLFLHYWANGRKGQPFWDAMRAKEPPLSLQAKLDAWKASGQFVRYEWESFHDPSWLSMYAGFEIRPDRHSPLADRFDERELLGALEQMKSAIAATLKQAAPHRQFYSD